MWNVVAYMLKLLSVIEILYFFIKMFMKCYDTQVCLIMLSVAYMLKYVYDAQVL